MTDQPKPNNTNQIGDPLHLPVDSDEYKGTSAIVRSAYPSILEGALSDPALSDLDIKSVMKILWTSICAREPLSLDSISVLVEVDVSDQARLAFQKLRPVMNISEAGGLVTWSPKEEFAGYVLSLPTTDSYHYNASQQNQLLAQQCFAVMKAVPRPFNICQLKSSYMFNTQVSDIHKRMDDSISESLLYACKYWEDHVRLAADREIFSETLYDFLSDRLLMWIEVLSLKGLLAVGGRALYSLRSYFAIQPLSDELKSLIDDAFKFTTMVSTSPVSRSNPHIYISALQFWPEQRPVSICYRAKLFSGFSTAEVSPRSRGRIAIVSPADTNGHFSGTINTVSYSPDGSLVATGSDDSTICIWDATTSQIVGHLFDGHSGAVRSVMFAPDQKHVASSSSDGTICIWDVSTSQQVGDPLTGHTSSVSCVAYTPNGLHVVSSSEDRTVRIWDAEQRRKMGGKLLRGHNDVVHSVACSPNDIHIASGSSDKTIRIWNMATGQLIGAPLEGHAGAVFSVSYSPDGAHLASGSSDNTVRIWDSHTGQMIVGPLEGYSDGFYSVAYSPDGLGIAAGSANGLIQIWDAHSGRELVEPLVGHNSAVRSITYSPDSAQIVSCGVDEAIRFWSISSTRLHSDTWQVTEDGWVVSSRSELLMWVPNDLIPVLVRPRNTALISRHGVLKLDFKNAKLGERWEEGFEIRTDEKVAA